jgi:hypothetical protein
MLRLNWVNNAWILALAVLPFMALVMEATTPANNNFVAGVMSQRTAIVSR